jgi:hypothetical protein
MQTTTIPDEIVALTEALARELSAWSRAHHGATLAEHEQGVLQLGRRFLGAALGAVVRQAQGLNQPATRRLREACPGCGQRRQPHDPARARQVLTVCGAVHLERPYDYCPACRRGWIPVDERLGLGRRAALSVGASGWAAKAGAGLPFRAAAALLEDLAGVAIGAETVRAHAEGVGRVLAATRQTMAEQVAAEREPVGPVEAAPGLLVLQADGAQLRYIDDWHEVKLGLVAGCQPGEPATAGHPEQAPTLLEPTYVAARAAAAAFGTLWLAEAAQRGALEVLGWEDADGAQATDVRVPALAVLPEVVVLGDGAPWIWTVGRGALWPPHRDPRLVSRQRASLDARQGAAWREHPCDSRLGGARQDAALGGWRHAPAAAAGRDTGPDGRGRRGPPPAARLLHGQRQPDQLSGLPRPRTADRLRSCGVLGQAVGPGPHEARRHALEHRRRAGHPRPHRTTRE